MREVHLSDEMLESLDEPEFFGEVEHISKRIPKSAVAKNNKSGFTGVHWCRRRRKWVAQIASNKRRITLGAFPSSKVAAMAYDKAAMELHGDSVRLNFPNMKQAVID